jgi:hypothetical protein
VRIYLHQSTPYCLDRDYQRPATDLLKCHPIEIIGCTGILTSFPSATLFSLALGADLPWEDYLYPGNLRFSAGRDLTSLFVTHACILSSDTSSMPYNTPSSAYRMLLYHQRNTSSIRSFGTMLSPVTLSAHNYSTSELLRTL